MRAKRDRSGGVYLLVSESTGAHYIGSSYDFLGRGMSHFKDLVKNKHPYQKHFKAPVTVFLLQRLVNVPYAERLKIEDKWAQKFPDRVNKFRNATGKGRKLSEQTKSKLRLTSSQHRHTKASRRKISLSLIGNKRSLGFHASEETRAKLRKGRVGRKPALGMRHSEETKRKMSRDRTGRKHTQAFKDRIREANLQHHMDMLHGAWGL